ncbi:MAG: radical SAM protein [Planctomycetaceae bacterium]
MPVTRPLTAATSPPFTRQGLHVMAKPIGPICNLDCEYCYYLHKEDLYPGAKSWRMSGDTLERYIQQLIAAQPDGTPEIHFAWQGGEPTLLGLPFFERVVELQRRYAPAGVRLVNALQTNGTLLDDAWSDFFASHRFLIGLSIDGPAELHDRYRYDKHGRGSFSDVLRRTETAASRRRGVQRPRGGQSPQWRSRPTRLHLPSRQRSQVLPVHTDR